MFGRWGLVSVWPPMRWWCRVKLNKRLNHPQTVRLWTRKPQDLCRSPAFPTQSTVAVVSPRRTALALGRCLCPPTVAPLPIPQIPKSGNMDARNNPNRSQDRSTKRSTRLVRSTVTKIISLRVVATSRVLDSHEGLDLQAFIFAFKSRT